MAKKKLDVFANEEYMNNATLMVLTSRMKAVQKRNEYIWNVPTKFHSQEIYKNCNSETDVNEEDKSSLRCNTNLKINDTLTKINSEGKQAASRHPKKNVSERYQKQISASLKSETVRNEKEHQQKNHGEYLHPGKEEEYLKEVPDTKQSYKHVAAAQNIFEENQNFASKMNLAETAVNADQLHKQMKNDSHSSKLSDNYRAPKMASKVSHERKLPDDPRATQYYLKRKQKFTFGSTGSMINEYHQPRRDLNSISSAQRIRHDAREKRIRREFEAQEKNNSLKVHNFTPDTKQHSSTEKCVAEEFVETTKSLLCLNIWKNDDNQEFIIFLSDLNKIKEKYGKISEVIPEINTEGKEIKYCFDTVKAVMTFLFQPPYKLDVMPKVRTAIEILAASKSWEIHDLRSHFLEQFLSKCLSQENVEELYSLAYHFGQNDVCDACKNLSKDDLPNLTNKYGQKSCFIKIETYSESVVFHIPLVKARTEAQSGQYKSGFQTEISNEIMFEAISGNYAIKGFEINLNVDHNNNTKDLPASNISYDVQNSDENIVFDEQKTKPLRSKIIIYFKKKLIVKAKQKAKITVETYIRPCLCSVVKNKKITEKNSKGEFNLSMTSTCKSQWNEERFLVGNILYNYL